MSTKYQDQAAKLGEDPELGDENKVTSFERQAKDRLLAYQHRQLGDVGSDPPGLVAGQ
jgi:hypothetical protein